MKKIAILQSNYIPWKGYFDLIGSVDEFVFYDDMQFTKNDWRNRNKIKTPQGAAWLSVPVGQNISRTIREVTLPNSDWQAKHWRALQLNYKQAPQFDEIADLISPLYLNRRFTSLSELNHALIGKICEYLGIVTKLSTSWDYKLLGDRNERLVNICRQADAQVYVSGPAAKAYISDELFDRSNIQTEWFSYEGYPPYPQLWGEFEHAVSILDLLFNCGKTSPQFMKFGKK
ncbi:MAG: WbqC family protein [Bdellovibrionaceae bacterium]|nr:WbqC family protein [Pseudobdellovibrionaceae bacterium]